MTEYVISDCFMPNLTLYLQIIYLQLLESEVFIGKEVNRIHITWNLT